MKKVLIVCFLLILSLTFMSEEGRQALSPDFELSVSKMYASIPESAVVINVQNGDWFNLDIESNPGSTGYDWYISEKYDEKVIILVSKGYRETEHPENMTGVPGITRCLFHAVGEGITEFTLVYERAWEKDVPPAKTLKVKVICE